MKRNVKRLLATVLALCLTMSPAVPALADVDVTPTPGSGSLKVQYFPSTLFNWDEAGANAATAALDYVEGDTTEVVYINMQDGTDKYNAITWGDLASKNTDGYEATEYYVRDVRVAESNTYYRAYIYRSNYSFQLYADVNNDGKIDTSNDIQIASYTGQNYDSNWPAGNKTFEMIYDGGNNDTHSLYVTSTMSSGGSYEGKGFYFTDTAEGKPDAAYVPLFSKWTGGDAVYGTNSDGDSLSGAIQNWHIYSGLAASKLSESTNAPFNTDVVTAAPLFSTENLEETASWKNVFQNIDVPYVYDSSTGYYEMNSDLYAVYFEGGRTFVSGTAEPGVTDANAAVDGIQMAIADKPASYKGANGVATGFQPFEDVSDETQSATTATNKTTTAYELTDGNDGQTYGFGMVTEVPFMMTDDGKTAVTDEDGNTTMEDIVFTFSGDDDVWVYVDGILALDIGGTHNAIEGTINFATGAVTLQSYLYGIVGDKASHASDGTWSCVDGYDVSTDEATLSQTNLYTALGKTLTQFASEGRHTLTIYYMDRGKGNTNSQIKFNLPQRDTVEVTKVLGGAMNDEGEVSPLDPTELAQLSNVEFSFTLYEEDSDGEMIPKASAPFYIIAPDGTQTSSTTSAAGTFTLKANYTARFLVDIGTSSRYYVEEAAQAGFRNPVFDYTSNITGASAVSYTDYTDSGEDDTDTIVTQLRDTLKSMVVTASGTDSATDTISFVCTNYLDQNLPNPSILPNNDQIVIDYGLPIRIDGSKLLSNDTKRGNYFEIVGLGTIVSKVAAEDAADSVSKTDTQVVITKDEITTTYDITAAGTAADSRFGSYVLDSSDANADGYLDSFTITYTLEKELTDIDTLYYIVKATGQGNSGDVTVLENTYNVGQIKIIPATSMYYEENFGGTKQPVTVNELNYYRFGDHGLVYYSNYTIPWTPVGSESIDYQETGYVGEGLSTYGSDPAYLTNLGDSNGTSMYANCTTNGAFFEYDFTGTGTAIYGRISTTSAYIEVKLSDNATGELLDTQYIDTIINTGVAGATELYNIPIYNNDALDYGNYHVRVYVYKQGTPSTNANGASGPAFYLDGIRVYRPLGWSEDDTEAYTTAADAYAADNEANVEIVNIRAKVVVDAENTSLGETPIFTLTDVSGTNVSDLETVTDYEALGPNEELYLTAAEGKVYTVSFSLVNWDSKLYDLYLGMKAPDGSTAKVTINGTLYEIKNSADCYYKISDDISVTNVTLKDEDGASYTAAVGTVTIVGNDGLASLTNLKVTGTDVFDLSYKTDIEVDGTEDEVTDDESGTDGDDVSEDEITTASELGDTPAVYSRLASTANTASAASVASYSLNTASEENVTEEAAAEESGEAAVTFSDYDPNTLYLVSSSYAAKLISAGEALEEIEEPEEEQPEEEAVFEPEMLDVEVDWTQRIGRVTIVVKASDDVDTLTINGEQVRAKRSRNGVYFFYTERRVKAGTVYEIVAYNADGVAGEAQVVTVGEEAGVFQPEELDIDVSYNKRRGSVTIKVTASRDVESITINGETVRRKGSRGGSVFSYTEKRVERGEAFEVVAYDENGTASEAYTVYAK